MVSLGIGLTTLVAIAQIEGNLKQQLAGELPSRAPNFYFIDIQPDQAARFDRVAGALPGVEEVRRVPSLRARVVSVKGVPAEQVQTTPETAWALRGDRGLTYAARPPAGSRIVAGEWWAEDYRGPPLLSFDAGVAAGWGVGVGDTITVNVLGRDIELRIANLRQVDWRGPRHELRPGRLARPAGSGAAHPHRHRPRRPGAGRRRAARHHRRLPQRLRHPGAGRAGGDLGAAPPGGRGACRRPGASPSWPGSWCWAARWRRGSGSGCGTRWC